MSHGQTEHSRALRARAPHVSFLQEANKALRAIAAVARARESERLAGTADLAQVAFVRASRGNRESGALARARRSTDVTALDEVESKKLLAAYGIPAPAEALVTSPAEALSAADRIGYPVVLKAVSATLTHKSDAGAVALNLASRAEVAAAYEAMADRLRAAARSPACWSAGKSAAGSSWCWACTAIRRWAWW